MLNDKTALVTGGSRGIGRAVALELAAQGANVAVIYASNAQQADEVCVAARQHGVQAECYQCDVSDAQQVSGTVDEVKRHFGGLDILVNNAGITADALMPMMSEQSYDRVMDINLKGCFLMTKAVYGIFLKQRSGRIINISSVAGTMGNAGQANYAASKAGMIGLGKSVARELAPRGITCNTITPGFIKSDMTESLPEATRKAVLASIPMRRMGECEDVARLAAFLATDAAGYITGAVLPVDGGMSM